MIKVGIVGVSGYSGATALELLLNHPHIRLTYLSTNNTRGLVSDIWPRLLNRTELNCEKYNPKKARALCDLILLAVPHTVAMELVPDLLAAKKRVIDFSGDYRLRHPDEYQKWYKVKHKDSGRLSKAVYGLPEFYRSDIQHADLVSNPGCYPTAALIGLAPLCSIHGKLAQSIIIDAKSGVTGAGRKVDAGYIFAEVNENFKAYKVLNHQHSPEIDLYLSKFSDKKLAVNFVPHLLPVNRGILETIYIQLKKPVALSGIYDIYKKFYKTEPFVRILKPGQQPELKNVFQTNYCDIGLAASSDERLIVITSAIDNLMKGAAGQAVQNMNIMYGFKETQGLL